VSPCNKYRTPDIVRHARGDDVYATMPFAAATKRRDFREFFEGAAEIQAQVVARGLLVRKRWTERRGQRLLD